jgi:polar amino acid transport system substrate-binding protein
MEHAAPKSSMHQPSTQPACQPARLISSAIVRARLVLHPSARALHVSSSTAPEIHCMRYLTRFAIVLLSFMAWVIANAALAQGKCEPDAVAKKYPSLVGKTIIVAAAGEGAPFSFRDSKNFENLIGFDSDIARAAFACIGVKMEFKIGAWSGLLPAVIASQANVMWNNLYYTPARAKQVDFVTHLIAATTGMVRKGNPRNIHSLDDVCGARTAAGLGTVEEASFRQVSEKCVAAGKPPVEITTYPDRPSGVRMLQNDRIDAMMSDAGALGYIIATSPNEFERGYTMLTNYKVGPGIRKDLPELRQAIFDALTILQQDGTQKELMVKYSMDPELARPVELHTE